MANYVIIKSKTKDDEFMIRMSFISFQRRQFKYFPFRTQVSGTGILLITKFTLTNYNINSIQYTTVGEST